MFQMHLYFKAIVHSKLKFCHHLLNLISLCIFLLSTKEDILRSVGN